MPRPGPRIVADYLVPNLNAGTFGNQLEWVAKGERIFRMVYKHKNNANWTIKDAAVFVEWDRLKDPYRHKPDEVEYYTLARQRMNAAMNKLVNVGMLQRVIIGETDSKDFKYFKVIREKPQKWAPIERKDVCNEKSDSNRVFKRNEKNIDQCSSQVSTLPTLHGNAKSVRKRVFKRNERSILQNSPKASTLPTPNGTNMNDAIGYCKSDVSTQCTTYKKTFRLTSDNYQDQFLRIHFIVPPEATHVNPKRKVRKPSQILEYKTKAILKTNLETAISECSERIAERKMLRCSRYCAKTFADQESLKRHRREHSMPKPSEHNYMQNNGVLCKTVSRYIHPLVSEVPVPVPVRVDLLLDIISDFY